MPDWSSLIEVIKLSALQAVESTKPAGVYFGIVTSVKFVQLLNA